VSMCSNLKKRPGLHAGNRRCVSTEKGTPESKPVFKEKKPPEARENGNLRKKEITQLLAPRPRRKRRKDAKERYGKKRGPSKLNTMVGKRREGASKREVVVIPS